MPDMLPLPARKVAEANPDAARAEHFRRLAREAVKKGEANGDPWAGVQGKVLLRMADRYATRQKLPPEPKPTRSPRRVQSSAASLALLGIEVPKDPAAQRPEIAARTDVGLAVTTIHHLRMERTRRRSRTHLQQALGLPTTPTKEPKP